MFLPQTFVVFSFVLYASALSTHHIARPLHHRAIGARFVAPIADAQPVQQLQPRRLSKRCRPRHSPHHSSSSASTPTSPPERSHSHSAYTPPEHTPHTHTPSPPPPPPSTPTTPSQPTATSRSGSGGDGGDSGNEPSFMIGLQIGEGTYYSTGLGACGITNNDSQYIAAVSHLLFDVFPGYDGVNPNNNPVCGRKIKVNYHGASVIITVTDRCTGCALTDLDFSPAAFNQLADPSVGRLFGMDWEWIL